MIWLYVLLGILILLILIFIIYYNRIIVLENRIKNSFSQIDVQLKRRMDLLTKLIATVKGYAKYEKNVFIDITKARASMLKANSFDDKMKASDKLSKSIKSLFAVAEKYPDLKANENFMQLQEEISFTENKIAYARQFFNDSVLVYNNLITTFPGVMIAKIINRNENSYLEFSEKEKKDVDVSF